MSLSRNKQLVRTGFKPPEPKPEVGRRKRKCAVCRESFEPRNMMHKVCKPECAVTHAEVIRKAQERKVDSARRTALKSRADHAREAQTAMNAWVRFRDRLDGCISCDKGPDWQGQWHASHFISVGACQTTRFDPSNLHKACSICNNHLSGNIRSYRPRLIAKIGQVEVDRLEGWHEPKKFSIEELKAIKAHYVAALKKLKEQLK